MELVIQGLHLLRSCCTIDGGEISHVLLDGV